MKYFAYISVILLLASTLLHGQSVSSNQINEKIDPILYFTNGSTPQPDVIKNYNTLFTALSEKQEKFNDELRFLKHLFNYVHRKQLNTYQQYATITETLGKSKRYNCVSGTALYAMLLSDLGYHYSIKEFDYHVLLIVHLADRDVLLESTDPYNGFVDVKDEINEILDSHLKVKSPYQENEVVSHVFAQSMRDIELSDLAGLQYYNSALIHYNKQEYFYALVDVKKAYALYPSNRIKGIHDLISELHRESSVAIK